LAAARGPGSPVARSHDLFAIEAAVVLRGTESSLTLRWREKDSNPRSLYSTSLSQARTERSRNALRNGHVRRVASWKVAASPAAGQLGTAALQVIEVGAAGQQIEDNDLRCREAVDAFAAKPQ